MHLAFLTPEYPHPRVHSSAGIGTSVGNLAVALAAQGIKVSVFVYGQRGDAVFSENGIKFHLIRQRTFSLAGWFFHRKFLQYYLNKFVEVDRIEVDFPVLVEAETKAETITKRKETKTRTKTKTEAETKAKRKEK